MKTVIVGASMGGQTAAVQLRKAGYTGQVVLISDEPHRPYDRPPLSKKVLTGEWDLEKVSLKPAEFYADLDIDLQLNTRVVAVDAGDRSIRTASGQILPYGTLILATGGRPRRLRIPGSSLAGVHRIGCADDAIAIRDELDLAERIVVVGAGFIGSECAAALRAAGKEVTLVEISPAPMSYALGEEVANVIADVHRGNGVHLAMRTTVAEYGSNDGRVTDVRTTDGRVFPADLVIEAIGIEPNLELAESAGAKTDGAVLVDEFMRTSVENIYAVGDIAAFPSSYATGPRAAEATQRIRVEHWAVAMGHAAAAANHIAGSPQPFDELPWFWTDQYGITYNVAGHCLEWDHIVWRNSPESGSFSAFYMVGDHIGAALCANAPRDFRGVRMLIEKRVLLSADDLKNPEVNLLKLAKLA